MKCRLKFVRILFLLLPLVFRGTSVFTQESGIQNKALNFPVSNYGVSIGNSSEFNGIRMNFVDKHVKYINGLNLTLWAEDAFKLENWKNSNNFNSVVNGINIGVIPSTGTMNALNIGLIGLKAAPGNINGLSAGGLMIISWNKINGFAVSSVLIQSRKVNGFAICCLMLGGVDGINGLAVAGLAVSSDDADINGLAISPAVVFCGSQFRGIGFAGIYFQSETVTGFAVGGMVNTVKFQGLSIALYNRTDELHGVQLGLFNHAGNNKKAFRNLPFLNCHF